MNKSYAFHLIKEKIYELEKTRITNFLKQKYGSSQEKIISFETDIPPVSLRTYYLPVYLYSWELPRDEIFYKYLNGFNRRYYGDTEYSFIKLFGIQSGFLFLTPLTLALQIREIPVFLTFSSASLSVFALGMIAWISRIISFRTPLHTKRKEKLKISEEIAQNTQYQEQDQIDTEMEFLKSRKKEDKEEEVKEKKYSSIELSIPEAVCILFNLDFFFKREKVRQKYYKQIKKWHPDMYTGDSTLAVEMTQKINAAYVKITNAMEVVKKE